MFQYTESFEIMFLLGKMHHNLKGFYAKSLQKKYGIIMRLQMRCDIIILKVFQDFV